MNTPDKVLDFAAAPSSSPHVRDVLIWQRSAQRFGVFADEVLSVVEMVAAPAPLPHAPPSVSGVISVRGRMMTVIDPLILFAKTSDDAVSQASRSAHAGAMAEYANAGIKAVVLRGDEQLALAADAIERTVAIRHEEIQSPAASDHSTPALRGFIKYGDNELIRLLNGAELFAAAMRGAERRRQRSPN